MHHINYFLSTKMNVFTSNILNIHGNLKLTDTKVSKLISLSALSTFDFDFNFLK